MFKLNDYVVYGSTGVCLITDIVKEQDAHGEEIEYYVLQSICENNLTIKIPVTISNADIRKPISKQEVLSLIAMMPKQECIWIKKISERNLNLMTALKSRKCEEWAKLIKTIYVEKQGNNGKGKKLAKTYEDIMQAAEKKLFGEMALALNISPDEVVPYIREHIPNN